jgi:ParB-like chromosome segregation protein Spo0J
VATIPIQSIRFVKELYPRIKPNDEAIERYRDSLEKLPPIIVARDGVLVDGYHRWQAHVREGIEQIQAEDLGNLSDAEIMREAITRNASHGQQLSRQDKAREAGRLWKAFENLEPGDREKEIADLLASMSRRFSDGPKTPARKRSKRCKKRSGSFTLLA